MSRITGTFERLGEQRKKALIPFVTAGDPSLAVTLSIMRALVEAGADIIELGVPFSDPMADGPIIQRASERALQNGVGLGDVLDCVRAFRRGDDQTPVVLMGYANPLERMGYAAFGAAACEAGLDGVLVVDYPPEESASFRNVMETHGIDVVYLLAPTSSAERIALVATHARGYVYYVSLKGVTGAAHIDTAEVGRAIAAIRGQLSVPIGVGFGIRDAATARQISAFADAVVIGSRIVQEIESSAVGEVAIRVGRLVAGFRAAMDAG